MGQTHGKCQSHLWLGQGRGIIEKARIQIKSCWFMFHPLILECSNETNHVSSLTLPGLLVCDMRITICHS